MKWTKFHLTDNIECCTVYIADDSGQGAEQSVCGLALGHMYSIHGPLMMLISDLNYSAEAISMCGPGLCYSLNLNTHSSSMKYIPVRPVPKLPVHLAQIRMYS